MYRARIEKLEDRKLFSVTDLIIDPFHANVVGDFNGDDVADAAEVSRSGLPFLTTDPLGPTFPSSHSTRMLRTTAGAVAPVNIDLLGALVDTSPIALSAVSLDTWEHAYSFQDGPATNGIIGILIGLAADPADPSGNTVVGAKSWSGEELSITHDREFETWASVSKFDRGYLPPALEDVLVSGILHEENEFSVPRMFTGGVRVG